MYYSRYKSRSTDEILTREELLLKFYNISFPVPPWPQQIYDYIGYDPIIENVAPTTDNLHVVVDNGLKQLPTGEWETDWIIVDRFATEEEKNAYINETTASELVAKWNKIRITRDALLKETDYTQLPDTPITDECRQAFVTYRSALRDITNQPDPYNIVWPEIPTYTKAS